MYNFTNKELSYVIQFFHMLLDILYCFYIFLFPIEYDIYFLFFILFIVLHWCFFYNECLISYLEKKLIDSKYVLASDVNNIPHHKTFYNEFIVNIIHLLIFINLSFIFYRSESYIRKLMAVTGISIGGLCMFQ